MRAKLHLLTDGTCTLESVYSILSESKHGDIDWLHIREPQRSTEELLVWMERLSHLPQQIPLIIHDRLDLWKMFRQTDRRQADCPIGLQLGYRSQPWQECRSTIGPNAPIGCSIHDSIQLQEAVEAQANWCIFGHIYETSSKPGLPGRGLNALRDICRRSPLPVIAIGGIQPEHVTEILATGAAGIAILSPVWRANDPIACIRRYRAAINEKEQPE